MNRVVAPVGCGGRFADGAAGSPVRAHITHRIRPDPNYRNRVLICLEHGDGIYALYPKLLCNSIIGADGPHHEFVLDLNYFWLRRSVEHVDQLVFLETKRWIKPLCRVHVTPSSTVLADAISSGHSRQSVPVSA
ncbi:hypothetical protein [Mycobacterium ahvazicum]|uniref:hypothetical protein n=1 Tax=Mycobacterium ahvazicum TaxID=1964395 RepID=UPI0013FD6932|nr:hypothetical protein [Mycobacterium ahvazicum]